MEIRFVPKRPWEHFPGLFSQKLGKRFSQEVDLGVAQIPQVIRDQTPALADTAYRRLIGADFILQIGPRLVGLVTKRDMYPGWDAYWSEMAETIEALKQMKIMGEIVRIGLRYVNFFSFDIFDKTTLTININGRLIANRETGFNTVFLDAHFRHFVQINNSSLIPAADNKTMLGSILDIDTTSTVPIKNLFSEAKNLFHQAHIAEKSVFYGLLKPEFIATLNPEY